MNLEQMGNIVEDTKVATDGQLTRLWPLKTAAPRMSGRGAKMPFAPGSAKMPLLPHARWVPKVAVLAHRIFIEGTRAETEGLPTTPIKTAGPRMSVWGWQSAEPPGSAKMPLLPHALVGAKMPF